MKRNIDNNIIEGYKLSQKIDKEVLGGLKNKKLLTDDDFKKMQPMLIDNHKKNIVNTLFLPKENIMNTRLNELAQTSMKFKIVESEEMKLWFDTVNYLDESIDEFKNNSFESINTQFTEMEEELKDRAEQLKKETFSTPKILTDEIQQQLESTLAKITERNKDSDTADKELIKSISKEIDTRFRTIIVKESKDVYENLMEEIGGTLNDNNTTSIKAYINTLLITVAFFTGIGLTIALKTFAS